MALLEVDGLSVSFGGVRAIDDVSLRVNRGEVLGLIGPNGAGKTTLFNCVTGIVTPREGTIRFDGRAIRALPPHRRAPLGIARTVPNLRMFRTVTGRQHL